MFFFSYIFQAGIAAKTGFPTEVKRLRSRPLSGSFSLSELEIRNPGHFPCADFLRVEKIEVKAAPASFLGGRVLIRNLEIEISHLIGVKSVEGATNVEEFRVSLEEPGNGEKRKRPEREFCIDRLLVKVGRLVTYDYTGGGIPEKKEYVLELAREFFQVKDLLPVGAKMIEDLREGGICICTDSIFEKGLSEKNRNLLDRYWRDFEPTGC